MISDERVKEKKIGLFSHNSVDDMALTLTTEVTNEMLSDIEDMEISVKDFKDGFFKATRRMLNIFVNGNKNPEIFTDVIPGIVVVCFRKNNLVTENADQETVVPMMAKSPKIDLVQNVIKTMLKKTQKDVLLFESEDALLCFFNVKMPNRPFNN